MYELGYKVILKYVFQTSNRRRFKEIQLLNDTLNVAVSLYNKAIRAVKAANY